MFYFYIVTMCCLVRWNESRKVHIKSVVSHLTSAMRYWRMIFLPGQEKELGISRFRWPFQNRWCRRDSVFAYVGILMRIRVSGTSVYGPKVSPPTSRLEESLEFWSDFPITLVIDANYLWAMFSRIVYSSEKCGRYIAMERHPMMSGTYWIQCG